jgi:hypothetical protein
MYGFNPWVDQLDDINRIVAESGENEATVLRKLIDEALIARRQKVVNDALAPVPSEHPVTESLETIQTLLLKLVRQGETSLRMEDITMALAQDILGEARACRTLAWEQTIPSLKEQGMSSTEIAQRFETQTAEAKKFAYRLAKELTRSQDAKR